VLGTTDGGDGEDGGDTGPCVEGAKACDPLDPSVLLECTAGAWTPSDCDGGTYCFFKSPTDDESTCVPDCTTTADCGRDEYYCNQDTHHCEAKGGCDPAEYPQCVYKAGNDSIKECDDESRMVVETPCGQDKYCHDKYIVCLDNCVNDADCEGLPDAVSPEPNSCNLGNNKCQRVDLCPTYKVCGGSESCELGTCVLTPTTNANGTGGTPDLQCFKDGAPADNGVATECNLKGNVTILTIAGDPRTADTIGLLVKAYSLADALAGDLTTPLANTTATDNEGFGYYQFTNPLPTKQDLVLFVESNGPGENEYVSLYFFGVYLRADACDASAGTLEIDVPTLTNRLYATYIDSGIVLGINMLRGLIMARVFDCKLDRVIHATVGSSLKSEATYYLLDIPAWMPDTTATETAAKGFFGAANVTPIRGVISALAKESSGMVSLGTYDIRVFPHSISTLYFKEPLKPN